MGIVKVYLFLSDVVSTVSEKQSSKELQCCWQNTDVIIDRYPIAIIDIKRVDYLTIG